MCYSLSCRKKRPALLSQYQVLAAFSFAVFVMAAMRGAMTFEDVKFAVPYSIAAGTSAAWLKLRIFVV